jgi:hypothetical protein
VKHLACLLLAILIISVAFSFYQFPTAKADITATRTFTASTSDGYIYSSALNMTGDGSSDYNLIHELTWGGISSATSTIPIGQDYSANTFTIYRGYLFFDTSAIPDSATINSATLRLYVQTDLSTTDFNVTIQNGQPTYPHNPLDSGDYYQAHYSGTGGTNSSSAISGVGYWNIALSSTGLGWLSTTGQSKFALRSSEDLASSMPTTPEYVTFYSSEQGDAYAPTLTVTYTASVVYTYNFHGPYLDSGSVYNGHVNCTVYQSYNTTESFLLDGTGGTADSETRYYEQQAVLVSWNITDSGNYTRTYYFSSAFTENVYIYIPNPDLPIGLYTFTVTDFRGIRNGYLQILTYQGTTLQVLGQRQLDSVNPVPFYLTWGQTYYLRVVCTDGTLDMGSFTALSIENTNLIIPYDAFPITYYSLNATVNAMRQNNTWIQMNYTDWSSLTIWVSTTITHSVGYTAITDYSDNQTSNTIVLNWNSANADTDYLVTVIAYRDGTENTYNFICPHTPNESNPWAMLDALLADVNGFPIRPRYMIGLALVLAFVGIFSYAHAVAGAFAGVLSSAFLTVIGWLQIHWILISFAGAVAVFMAIADFKKTEREI